MNVHLTRLFLNLNAIVTSWEEMKNVEELGLYEEWITKNAISEDQRYLKSTLKGNPLFHDFRQRLTMKTFVKIVSFF